MTNTSPWENLESELLPGNSPKLLHLNNTVARVIEGSVDLFLVPLKNGKPNGRRTFIGHFEIGSVLFYLPEKASNELFGIVCVGTPETRLSHCPMTEFFQQATEAEQLSAITQWFTNIFSNQIFSQRTPITQQISIGESYSLSEHEAISTDDSLCWVAPGEYVFLPGFLDIPLKLSTPFPLTKNIWISVTQKVELSSIAGKQLLESHNVADFITSLNQVLINILESSREKIRFQDSARQEQRTRHDEFQKNKSLELLAKVFSESISDEDSLAEDPTTRAMQTVCSKLQISVTPVQHPRDNVHDHIQQLARASNIPLRRVLLRGRWWLSEGEPMIGFLEEGDQAVALIPKRHRGFECFNPLTGEVLDIDEELVQEIQGTAMMPYRSLPSGTVSGWDLVRFALFDSKADLARIALFGLFGGLLAMGVPLATGLIFDQVIPSSDQQQLLQLTIAIVVVAVASGVFQYLQGLSIVRLESRAGHALQSAVWDRIAKLPVNFFSQFNTGDLLQRAFGIDQIREQISSTVIRTVLSFVFSAFSIGLLFYYNVYLALWACLLVGIAVLFTTVTGLLSVPETRRQQNLEGTLTGFVLQCIEGISKIRITYSQDRAFYRWAGKFAEKRESIKHTQYLQSIDKIFSSVFPLLCSMAIFYLLIHGSESITLSTGSFLAFNAAFVSVLSNFLVISASLVLIFRMIPVYQRMMPILEQPIESDTATVDPGRLKGEIEIANLHFKYTDSGPHILNGINMHVKPGEFVALVGTSGGGKSTLFRILLGFETCDQGSIAFDGKEIAKLDKQELRRQMGVVLQSSSLMPGDIFTNIIGSANLTLDQAWEAARMAGFDEDIKSMPMGMHTILSEGGGGLSGGQKQRLQIARAFVHKPKILFFDEATSALDNRTQETVTKSMNELNATRIVIAHRLSTVIDADRILVLNKGKIEESGSYTELMAKKGLFFTMANRQIA